MKFLKDGYGRRFDYIRISLTDRCNLWCFYCKKSLFKPLPRSEILTLEEITFLVSIFREQFGIQKVRLTGGEPLLRKEINKLIENISGMNVKIKITTNGVFLDNFIEFFKEKKVSVNVSLDTLNEEKFFKISGDRNLKKVIDNIQKCASSGINLKINTVALRGINDDEILNLIDFSNSIGTEIRFIEFMPFVDPETWRTYFIPEEEIKRKILEKFSMRFLEDSGTAYVYKLDNGGRVGFISTVSRPFCDSCSRLRITADGKIVLCMFDKVSYPLMDFLRPKIRESELIEFITKVVKNKPRGFIELKGESTFEMTRLGG